jgi:DNA/RNA-binding domain of Phe-tRNA-synthetase-like protein
MGREGEEYAGIRKEVVHLDGRVTLADTEGPFGNPTSDSSRTMVTLRTRDVLVVVFTPKPLAARLPDVLDGTAARMVTFCGGRETRRQII